MSLRRVFHHLSGRELRFLIFYSFKFILKNVLTSLAAYVQYVFDNQKLTITSDYFAKVNSLVFKEWLCGGRVAGEDDTFAGLIPSLSIWSLHHLLAGIKLFVPPTLTIGVNVV